MRRTGFEPHSRRFAMFPASNPQRGASPRELLGEACAGPDSNRGEKCSLTLFAAPFSRGSNPLLLSRSVAALPRSVRGTGFEPADPYGIAS